MRFLSPGLCLKHHRETAVPSVSYDKYRSVAPEGSFTWVFKFEDLTRNIRVNNGLWLELTRESLSKCGEADPKAIARWHAVFRKEGVSLKRFAEAFKVKLGVVACMCQATGESEVRARLVEAVILSLMFPDRLDVLVVRPTA